MKNKPSKKTTSIPQQVVAPQVFTVDPFPIPPAPTVLDGLRKKVFLDRYAWRDEEGNPLEEYPEQMWSRVAKTLAAVEKTATLKKLWEEKFYSILSGFKFLPGGRILSGAGTGYEVTFFNCFVIPCPEDSREGIMDNIKAMVEIFSRAGGAGVNLSSLRPRGARVRKVSGTSSGPINWANLYSVASHDVVQQGGCFTADARIMTQRGLVKIEEIINSQNNYLAVTHQGFKQITARFNNGKKEVLELETAGGYKVKVTKEHKFMTFDGRGSFYLTPLSDLKVGDDIVLLPSNFLDDLPEAILNNNLPKLSKFSYGRKNVLLPRTLNSNLAFILGVYMSDGSRIKDEYAFAKGLRFGVDARREKDLNLLVNKLKTTFSIEPIIRKGDGAVMDVSIFSRTLIEFLGLNNMLKQNSSLVFVPEQIFTSPSAVIEAFISGVFFGDGGNGGGKGGFRIRSVNKKFLEDIALLLLNLGIASKVSTQKRNKWQDLHTLSVNGHKYMAKFLEMVKPYSEKAYDRPISKRNGCYNFPINILKRFAYLSGIQRTMVYSNPTTSAHTLSFMGNRMDQLSKTDVSDAEILISTITDKIKAIVKMGIEPVYDLEVADIHLLSGNGFYTSNSRRAALMIMINDWHPDVGEFATVKRDTTKLVGANLSFCISDKFMEAVEKGGDWDLKFPDTKYPEYDKEWDGDLAAWEAKGYPVKIYQTIKASDLWNTICESAWMCAEPGIHFLERSNKWSNNYWWEKLIGTNPCGEQSLPAWGVCNLGSVNLSAFVDETGEFNYSLLSEVVPVAIRMLDNVIDANFYFYPENKTHQVNARRVGLGTMGLGDALIKMKVRYGSAKSLEIIEKIYKTIRDTAYETSSGLAKEKGAFPKFDKEKYLKGYFVSKLPESVKEKIAKNGIRNSMLLTQAPTGSTSLLAGTSSGIEPVFDFAMVRRDRIGEHIIYHPLYQAWKEANPEGTPQPDYFASANDLTPDDHIKVQALIQGYTDSSISKTVNAPNSHTIEDVKKLYMDAYKLGCKGLTYMRDGSRDGVLTHIDEKSAEPKEQPKEEVPVESAIFHRPMVLPGRTYKMLTPIGEVFVTVNRDQDNYPVEVFITVGKAGMQIGADAEAIGRLISLSLRLAGGKRQEIAYKVISQLKGIGGAAQIGFGKERVMSLADAVAKVIAEDLSHLENIPPETLPLNINENGTVQNNEEVDNNPISSGQLNILSSAETVMKMGDLCPECGNATFVFEEGCKKCHSCGYSIC